MLTRCLHPSARSSATIQALEKQVQQTAVDIQDVKASFQQQLQTVITQNATMSNSIETLSITISRQNFVIACIQQEFKETMSDLYSKLNLSPPVITAKLGNPTAPQSAAPQVAKPLGGAKAWGPIRLQADMLRLSLA